MLKKKVMCMSCDFEGHVSWEDPIFEIECCPACGEVLTYKEEEHDEDTVSESEGS